MKINKFFYSFLLIFISFVHYLSGMCGSGRVESRAAGAVCGSATSGRERDEGDIFKALLEDELFLDGKYIFHMQEGDPIVQRKVELEKRKVREELSKVDSFVEFLAREETSARGAKSRFEIAKKVFDETEGVSSEGPEASRMFDAYLDYKKAEARLSIAMSAVRRDARKEVKRRTIGYISSLEDRELLSGTTSLESNVLTGFLDNKISLEREAALSFLDEEERRLADIQESLHSAKEELDASGDDGIIAARDKYFLCLAEVAWGEAYVGEIRFKALLDLDVAETRVRFAKKELNLLKKKLEFRGIESREADRLLADHNLKVSYAERVVERIKSQREALTVDDENGSGLANGVGDLRVTSRACSIM